MKQLNVLYLYMCKMFHFKSLLSEAAVQLPTNSNHNNYKYTTRVIFAHQLFTLSSISHSFANL